MKNPNNLSNTALLIGRILLSILFIAGGYGKLGAAAYEGTQQYMQSMGVPGVLLPLTILLELGGGIAIVFGFLTRTTSLFLSLFTLATALIFHTNFAEYIQQLMFMKNLAIAGGFLALAVAGSGKWSIDSALNKSW